MNCSIIFKASLLAQTVKNLPTVQETWIQSLGWEDPLEKKMATHSSILAWRIPCTEEPGGLQSMESQSQTQLSDEHSLSQGTSMNGLVESESCSVVSDTLQPHGV